MTDLRKYERLRLQIEAEHRQADAAELARVALSVRRIMESSSTPVFECPRLDTAYQAHIATSQSLIEYR